MRLIILQLKTVDQPIGRTPLEEKLHQAYTNRSDPSVWNEFTRLLLNSDVYVLGKVANEENFPADTTVTIHKDTSFAYATYEFKEEKWVPFFTSLNILESWLPAQKADYLKINCRVLFSTAVSSGKLGLILNPDSPGGRTFPLSEVESILKES